MKYRNVKTGAVISSPCSLSGENWVEVKASAQPVPEERAEKEEKPGTKKGKAK